MQTVKAALTGSQVTDFLFYVVAEAWPNRDVIYGYFSKVSGLAL